MGMYTEIFMRVNIRKDAPESVRKMLEFLTSGNDKPDELPDHEFFTCDRWDYVALSSSYYFPGTRHSSYVRAVRDYDADALNILANLKNYDGEIGKFFDWIDPYLEGERGDFIGYEMYEEDETPTLHRKAA